MKRLGLAMSAIIGCHTEPTPAARNIELPRVHVSSEARHEPTITIATYNVNYGRAGDTTTLDAIGAADADTVFLQETTAAWETRIRKRFAKRYPFMSFRHCCTAGGLAVLSKRPFDEREYIKPRTAGAWFPAWRVVLETAGGPIQVINVHLRPNIGDGGSVLAGLLTTPPVRQAEIAEYAPMLEPDIPAIVVGDFNEPANGGAVGHLAALGMKSALPEAGGEQDTWHWRTSLGEIEEQLDHIVYQSPCTLIDAKVLREGRSDHYPVSARFSCP